jgi:hypothetical protein
MAWLAASVGFPGGLCRVGDRSHLPGAGTRATAMRRLRAAPSLAPGLQERAVTRYRWRVVRGILLRVYRGVLGP